MSPTGPDVLLDQLSQTALDLMPSAVFVATVPDGDVVRINGRAAAWCGGERRAPFRLSECLRAVGADDTPLPAGQDPIAAALRNGDRLEDVEAVLSGSSGSVPVSVSIEPVAGPAGRPVATLTLCHRIARWKESTTALRSSEQRLTLALSAARLGAWEYDLQTRVLTSSPQCKANHGLGPHDDFQLDADLLPAIDPGHRDAFRATLADTIASGGSFQTEVLNVWPDGSDHWLLIAGRVVGRALLGVTLDVTERRRIESALRASEARFRTMADNIAQLAWMADAAGSLFWYNQRWLDYTGYTTEEMQGWGWQRVHHPDHVEAVVRKLRRCFETGEIWEDTFPLRGADGAYRWFLSRAVPIRDAQGQIVMWFGTNTDVTEQRRTEEALVAADRGKDEFLALLGHELRSPLAPILTAIRLLQAKAPADPAIRRLQQTILRQTLQLSTLVDDLLDVGRMLNGKLRLARQHTDLHAIVKQAVETCSPLIEERRHTLHLAASDTPISLDADAGRLVQVLCNLLNNAAKYMPEGGRIDLVVDASDGHAVVRVRDRGIGIAPDMREHIFQRFVQVESATHQAHGGLGIGLALVKAIVDLHGGSVEARSDGIGKGSEFIVSLPVAGGASSSPT